MKNLSADVVVVGSGAAGISAGLAASESGLKVIVLEKGAKTGGSGLFGAAGLMAYESKHQKAAGETATVQDGFETIINYTHYKSNAALARVIIGESAGTIDWLEKYGLQTRLVQNCQESHHGRPNTYHEYVDKYLGFKTMYGHLVDMGASVLVETAGQSLVVGKDGKIAGIDAVGKDGVEIKITAPVVIIGTGGYGGTKEQLAPYSEIPMEYMYIMGERESVGEGIRMAVAAGADLYKLDTFQMHFAVVAPEGATFDIDAVVAGKWVWENIYLLTGLPLLWVDSNGKRFTNELVVYDHALWANAVYTAGGHYYFLFDDASIQKFKSHGSDIKNSFERTLTEARNLTRKIPLAITGTVAPMPDIETELADAIAKHVAWKAPTLEKLAEQIGVDPAQLVATVTGYNKAIEDGVDALFFKPKEALKYAVAKGPFYAVQARSNILGTLGGIRVNEKLEALDKNRKPIAGLYAAGYDAGGLYGDSYCVTEGLTLGFAFNSGRIAGYSARDYLGASTGKS